MRRGDKLVLIDTSDMNGNCLVDYKGHTLQIASFMHDFGCVKVALLADLSAGACYMRRGVSLKLYNNIIDKKNKLGKNRKLRI